MNCPAATGTPQAGVECIITGRHHECMRPPETHPLHTCYCGSHWVSSQYDADTLSGNTEGQPVLGLTWLNPHDHSIWIAPIGTPPPGNPMPAAWLQVSKGQRR